MDVQKYVDKHENSGKTAWILRHTPIVTKRVDHPPGERKKKEIIKRAMPDKVRGLFTMNWFKELTRTTIKETYEISWDPGVRGPLSRFTLNSTFEKNEELLVLLSDTRTFRSRSTTEHLHAEIPGERSRRRAVPHRARKM